MHYVQNRHLVVCDKMVQKKKTFAREQSSASDIQNKAV